MLCNPDDDDDDNYDDDYDDDGNNYDDDYDGHYDEFASSHSHLQGRLVLQSWYTLNEHKEGGVQSYVIQAHPKGGLFSTYSASSI